MTDAIRIDGGAHPLSDHIDEVVLEILGHPRYEGDAHRGCEEGQHPAEEGSSIQFRVLGRVLVDHMTEDQRVEQGEDLVDGREQQRESHGSPMGLQVRPENVQSPLILLGRIPGRPWPPFVGAPT